MLSTLQTERILFARLLSLTSRSKGKTCKVSYAVERSVLVSSANPERDPKHFLFAEEASGKTRKFKREKNRGWFEAFVSIYDSDVDSAAKL